MIRLPPEAYRRMALLLDAGDPGGEVAASYLDSSCCARCTTPPT